MANVSGQLIFMWPLSFLFSLTVSQNSQAQHKHTHTHTGMPTHTHTKTHTHKCTHLLLFSGAPILYWSMALQNTRLAKFNLFLTHSFSFCLSPNAPLFSLSLSLCPTGALWEGRKKERKKGEGEGEGGPPTGGATVLMCLYLAWQRRPACPSFARLFIPLCRQRCVQCSQALFGSGGREGRTTHRILSSVSSVVRVVGFVCVCVLCLCVCVYVLCVCLMGGCIGI